MGYLARLIARSGTPRSEIEGAWGAISSRSCSPALVVLAIVIADAIAYCDADLWGHIRFGQVILAAGHVIRTDPYSYSAAGHTWIDHEWLTEVIMAVSYNFLGVLGLRLLKLTLTVLTFVFLAKSLRATRAPSWLQSLVLVVCAVAVSMQMAFRPQLFSFALLSAIIFLLARDIYQGGARLWLAIPILLLWANLHGAFIAGLAALGIYTASFGLRSTSARHSLGRAYKLGTITAAATFATFVTPYGLGTWHTVLHALTNPLTSNIIQDWQPFARALALQWRLSHVGCVYYLCALAMVAAFVVAIVLAPASDDLELIVVATSMIVSAAIAVRNLPLALIAIAPPLAHHLALAVKTNIATTEHPVREAAKAHMHRSWIQQGLLYALALSVMWESGQFSKELSCGEGFPSGAVRFMKSHELHGNVLNSFDWGEYLIWHLEPDSKVFVDGRYDTVYPVLVLKEMIEFNFNLPETAQVVGADPIDYMLLPVSARGNHPLQTSTGWKLGYRDECIQLYLRANSAVAQNPGVRVAIKQPCAAQMLVEYPHSFVLLRADAPANQLMELRSDWELVYRDDISRLYARAGSVASQIPGIPIIGRARATSFP